MICFYLRILWALLCSIIIVKKFFIVVVDVVFDNRSFVVCVFVCICYYAIVVLLDSNGDATMPPSVHELERTLEQLDTAQEELVTLSERCDKLEIELDIAKRRNRLLEKLTKLKGVDANEDNNAVNNAVVAMNPITAATASIKENNTAASGKVDLTNDGSQYDVNEAINIAKKAVTKGTSLWKSNRKDDCFDLYLDCCQSILPKLMTDELIKPLRDTTEHGRTQGALNKQRGAVILRKAVDKFLADTAQVSESSVWD